MGETHDSIVTNPYCGTDRWMDNAIVYSTWNVPGFMDRVHANLLEDDVIFKTIKNNVIYQGEFTFDLWLIEPGGQTLQLGGQLQDAEVSEYAPFAASEMCSQECDFGFV